MQRLVHALDAVKATRSTKAKVRHLAELLHQFSRDELPIATRLILGRVLPLGDTRTLGVHREMLNAAAADVCSRPSLTGDVGDALEVLLPEGRGHLPILEVPAWIDAVIAATGSVQKQRLLTELLSRCSPCEARFLVKVILEEQPFGVRLGLFEEALAEAFGATHKDLRRAAVLTPDPSALALLAFDRRLGHADLIPGSVVAFMLATPMEASAEPIDSQLTILEDKLVGLRIQAHVWDGHVRLFARGQDDVTARFPEVVKSLLALPRAAVLDGEVIAVRPNGHARPFSALKARLAPERLDHRTLEQTPVAFVAYDCLYDGEAIIEKPWTERRRRLEALPVRVNPVTSLRVDIGLEGQLDDAFTASRARGNEGLVLKRVDAPYDAGHRGRAWRKLHRSFATLDVVITQAEPGHGKNAGLLSDYTFAVWDGSQLLEIGHAQSGLADDEMQAVASRLEACTIECTGACHHLRPEVVIEVAFDSVQRSAKHSSGFALHFPRVARLRDDKSPREADTLATVKALFDVQMATTS